ncbi:hypothetical protein [Oleiagrimonas soli]|uniref:Uncharacterized protein n=1 Tax=Oleiagrimonas soli TaxID=1543381 RepID=A0A841KKC6_9GAMM|nr:hypothetical protein [Oleiagrimonas soli]MBB6185535.1 hypothetical protein [Oleiagrimonas soli]
MQRTFLLSALATALIATGGFALAQQTTPPAPPAPASQPMKMDGARPAWKGSMGGHRHGQHGKRGMHRMGRHGGPAGAVIADLRELSHLYVRSGKADQLPSLYNDVLAKTQDPMVRNYAYHALARAQMRPRDSGAAIATLRKSLNEDLTRLNAMKANAPK